LPANGVNLAYSNSVFEHVPKEAIREILRESQRTLRPGGLALHNVGCKRPLRLFLRCSPEVTQ
jgi:predicted SAM-dependent methyltransferase